MKPVIVFVPFVNAIRSERSHAELILLGSPPENLNILFRACLEKFISPCEPDMMSDLDEAVAQGAHAMFFQCGLGHMMGLDVHDMEDLGEVWVGHEGAPKSSQFGLKSLRLARALQPGFVFTVEPGLYFIPELMDRWRAEKRFVDFIDYGRLESYRDFGGIRIEEDFLVTEDGAQLLGRRKPRTAAEVEAQRALG